MRRTVLAVVLFAAFAASAFVGNDLDDEGVSQRAEDRDGDGECTHDDTDADGLPDCEDPDEPDDCTPTSSEDRDGEGDPLGDDADNTPDFLDDHGVPSRAEVPRGTNPPMDDIRGKG